MHWLFTSITDRLKALFVTDVALDFESQLVSRQAKRKAALIHQADEYEQQGYETVAHDLRTQAEQIGVERPLATVLPAIGELNGNGPHGEPRLLEPANGNGVKPKAATKKSKKKGR